MYKDIIKLSSGFRIGNLCERHNLFFNDRSILHGVNPLPLEQAVYGWMEEWKKGNVDFVLARKNTIKQLVNIIPDLEQSPFRYPVIEENNCANTETFCYE